MEFDIKMLEDPDSFAIGRIPAHTFFDACQVQEDGSITSSKILDLNGKWKFSYSENYETAVKGFERADHDCSSWAEINVPGHMQLQGYDRPHYANAPYPWDGKQALSPGQVPKTFNPIGEYVKYFDKPEVKDGYRIRIYFGGIESGAAIWLNGCFVGYKEDTFDAGVYDITDFLTEGINKLAVMVFKWTLGSWFEDQDFFRFSGIYRSVWLYSVPQLHVEDIKIRTLIDDDYRNAVLKVTLKAVETGKKDESAFSADEAARVRIGLYDKNGNTVFSSEEKLTEECTFDYSIDSPNLWSAEKPNLYTLTVETFDEFGAGVEKITQQVGFRRFEIKNGSMCINGKRIVFRGVNRHEFCSRSGRTLPEEDTLKDILTMKANNINAIRTSHYPNDQILYDLCDKYGLYMIAENNMETHGTWARPGIQEHKEWALPSDHMEYEPMLFDRVKSCYEIHKNHPCILIWSDGNESFGGQVIADMTALFKRLDPDRLVHYEGIFADRRHPETSDMESQMYTSVANVKKFLTEHKEKPMILCEYTHAMGNSCGGMHLYTDLTKTEPRFQGGFIWDYIDQSLDAVDRYGVEYQAYGGDFGDRPTEYNFSGNGIAYGDRTPSPKMQEVRFNYQTIDIEADEKTAKIINRNLFTDLSDYTARITVLKNGLPVYSKDFEIALKPEDRCIITLPIDSGVTDGYGEYANILSFHTKETSDYAPAGYEVAFGQYIYKVENEEINKSIERDGKPEGQGPDFDVIQGIEHIGIRGDDFYIMASKARGGIVSYVKNGREYINLIPMPNFWRAPTDNDRGNCMPRRYAQWKIASMYISAQKNGTFDVNMPEFGMTERGFESTYIYTIPTTPEASVKVNYLILGDGTVETTLGYDAVSALHDMPEFGMMFILSADLDNVTWYGLGPEETYADRRQGGKLGIYSNKVKDNMARYLRPQECGNKEAVRWGQVTDSDGHGIKFTAIGEPMCFSALPYTPHEVENATHSNELPPVHHTVVRVSLGQMGIAGDDSWGSHTLPEFLLNAEGHMEFRFSWKAV